MPIPHNNRTGSVANKMRVKSHPKVKANTNPRRKPPHDMTMFPTFSPVPLWIDEHSFVIFEAISAGFYIS